MIWRTKLGSVFQWSWIACRCCRVKTLRSEGEDPLPPLLSLPTQSFEKSKREFSGTEFSVALLTGIPQGACFALESASILEPVVRVLGKVVAKSEYRLQLLRRKLKLIRSETCYCLQWLL